MKRLIIFLITMVFILSFFGCKENQKYVNVTFMIQDTSNIVKVDKGTIITEDIIPFIENINIEEYELYFDENKQQKYNNEPLNKDTIIYVDVIENEENISTEELINRAKKRYLEDFIKGSRPNATIDDVRVGEFLGRYGNSIALLMSDGRNIFRCIEIYYIVADLRFTTGEDKYIYIYNGGRLFYLWDAYAMEIITYEDLYSIYKIMYKELNSLLPE